MSLPFPVPEPTTPTAVLSVEYHRKLSDCEVISARLYPEDTSVLVSLRRRHDPVRFTKGFACCKAWGKEFEFLTLSQRLVCEELWNEWQGRKDIIVKIPVGTLVQRIGEWSGKGDDDLQTKKIRNIFRVGKKTNRRPHPALGYLIHIKHKMVWMGPPSSAKEGEILFNLVDS